MKHNLLNAAVRIQAGVPLGDGIALTSIAHPGSTALTAADVAFIEAGGWRCSQGHDYCEVIHSPADAGVDPATIETVDIGISDPNRNQLPKQVRK